MSRPERAAANRRKEKAKRARWRKAKRDSAAAIEARWDAAARASRDLLDAEQAALMGKGRKFGFDAAVPFSVTGRYTQPPAVQRLPPRVHTTKQEVWINGKRVDSIVIDDWLTHEVRAIGFSKWWK